MNNQQNNPSNTTFIALAIIVVVALAIFFYTKGTPTDSTSSLDTAVAGGSQGYADAQSASDRILVLLNEIDNLKINDSLFKSAAYKSLTDYSISVPEENVGRKNPFAPVGGYFVPAKTVNTIR
jgi:hypothetical protein